MILYTVQRLEFWQQALQAKQFVADLNIIKSHFSPTDWQEVYGPAYQFMQYQMAQRLKTASSNYPIWAWVDKSQAIKQYYEDTSTDKKVAFAFQVPDDQVLLSNIVLYNTILCDDYLSLTSYESDDVDIYGYTTAEKIKSWERIFDLKLPNTSEQAIWLGDKTHQVVQACVDHIPLHSILEILLWPQ